MAIYRLMNEMAFDPDQAKVLSEAYEDTLKKLQLKDRNDRLTELIAKKIIAIARTKGGDAKRLSAMTLKELGISNRKK